MNLRNLFVRPKWDYQAFLAQYDAYDAQLVAKGFHQTSPWWRHQLERFLRSGCRRWVLRVGRRGGKSSFLCRLAVVWALHGPWSVPAGDVAIIPFVSVDRDEATGRIRTIRDICAALGVTCDPRTTEVELIERHCILRVETCSVTSVGFTSVLVIADEMARWLDEESNPSRDVMGSLRPTMATIPLAFEVCSSSAWSETDYHCELFDLGNNDHQVVSEATTWVANPTISEERTKELEPDEKVRLREYGNVPGGVVSNALVPDDVKRAFKVKPPTTRGTGGFCSIDPSSLRKDEFGYLMGTEVDGLIVVNTVGAFDRKHFERMSMADVVAAIAEKAKARGISTIFSDQRESAGLTSLFAQCGVTLEVFDWSERSKEAAFTLLRRLLKDAKISLCEHKQLRDEMLKCRAHLMPGGHTRYATSGLDYLSCLITLMHGREQTFSLASGAGKLDLAIRAAIARGEMYPNDGVSYQPGTPRNARQWEETIEC